MIKDGDLVSIDIGTKVGGFFGDTATTVAVGNVSEDKLKLMQTGKHALDEAIEQARSGNTLYDISFAVQRTAEGNGYSVVREFVGHGIGMNLHEEPQIPNYRISGKGPILKPGMVLAIEPMVNAGRAEVRILSDGWTVITTDRQASSHFEHTVLVTEGDPEILTWRPREATPEQLGVSI